MRVSIYWLRQLVETTMPVDDLANALTMAGLEVEEITPVAAPFKDVVVAEIKAVKPHPNADKLRVCHVDAGTGTDLQIVCGAPNVAEGQRVPCALVGAKLPGLDIKAATLRGIESSGMLCSAKELGIADDHGGLLVLSADAPIGGDVRKYLDLDDTYLTLKMTPNRGDCLSMLGIARDLAAATGAALRKSTQKSVLTTGTASRQVTISVPNACGMYVGRVLTGLNANASTPDWMRRRLERAGFRSIAALVDITNYVMLECGQPMHAFDHDKIHGGIEVRFAREGESMTLLNQQHVDLNPGMLLIADDRGPIAMGGVMGGLQSMCSVDTRNVFFEAAFFSPDVIRGKSRTLGINSDAAFRFERGVDPAGASGAIEYATQLAMAICGTAESKIGPISRADGVLPARLPVLVRPARANRLIGLSIPVTEMRRFLADLQCEVTGDDDCLSVIAPSHRFDLTIEEDFIEEVARIHGFDKIPVKAPVSSLPMVAAPEANRSRHHWRRAMAGLGYHEVISYSFVPEAWEADFAGNTAPLRLANPIASQMGVMRSTLAGGLLSALQFNLNHGESRVRLFEIGRCFLEDKADLSVQPERLAGVAYGPRFPEQWGEGGQKGPKTEFYAIKGDLESLLHGLSYRFERFAHPALHPGRAAQVLIEGELAGWIGELHPRWQQQYEFPTAPMLFEFDLNRISSFGVPGYRPYSRMQSVRRDVSVLLAESVEIQAVIDAIEKQKIHGIKEFTLFDLYRGENVETGKKSVAFRIVMQDTERTLTDSEADMKVSVVLEVMSKEFGATLRK